MSDSCPIDVLQEIHGKALELSPDAKIVINARGEIVVFNQQAEFCFGYARTEVLGQPIEVLLPELLKEKHKKHVQTYMQEPKTREMGINLQLNGVYRDGTQFPVQIKLAPMIITGAGTHAMAVVRRVSP